MAVDVNKVYIGAPDQETTGAVATAAVGTTMPTTARAALDSAWTASGYITSEGVSFSQDRSTATLKDWSGSNVRTVLENFTGSVQYSEMETRYETMCRMVGADNVVKTNATASAGEQLKVSFGPTLPPCQAFCFSMKDENRRMRLLIPNGQVTAVDSTTFVNNDAVKWNFTITANDDGTGHSIYLLTDDGKVLTNPQ